MTMRHLAPAGALISDKVDAMSLACCSLCYSAQTAASGVAKGLRNRPPLGRCNLLVVAALVGQKV